MRRRRGSYRRADWRRGFAPLEQVTEMPAENVDELRIAIDQGKTGDKVAFPDPAAAPLGTDDEAAGYPPTRQQVRLASSIRRSRVIHSGRGFPWPYLVIGGLVGILIVAMAYVGSALY